MNSDTPLEAVQGSVPMIVSGHAKLYIQDPVTHRMDLVMGVPHDQVLRLRRLLVMMIQNPTPEMEEMARVSAALNPLVPGRPGIPLLVTGVNSDYDYYVEKKGAHPFKVVKEGQTVEDVPKVFETAAALARFLNVKAPNLTAYVGKLMDKDNPADDVTFHGVTFKLLERNGRD